MQCHLREEVAGNLPAGAAPAALDPVIAFAQAGLDLQEDLSIPPLGVDVFAGGLKGLILAEAEFDSYDEMARFSPPALCVAEVTTDPRFTGARLAAVSRQELVETLEPFEVTLLTQDV